MSGEAAWRRVGSCMTADCGAERFWHAGLGGDGRYCLLFTSDCDRAIVWDVAAGRVAGEEAGPDVGDDTPEVARWVDPTGHYHVAGGPGAGRYRVFGIHLDNAKTIEPRLGLRVEIDVAGAMVRFVGTGDAAVRASFPFDAFSGDWAFASFSADGRVVAVLEPYFATFFGCDATRPGDGA